MASLGKIYTSMFGHSFLPEHIFSMIDARHRDTLLKDVPKKDYDELRRLSILAGAERRQAKQAMGGVADESGFLEAARAATLAVDLKEGEKPRKERIITFVRENWGKGKEPKGFRTKSTGFLATKLAPYILKGYDDDKGEAPTKGGMSYSNATALTREYILEQQPQPQPAAATAAGADS